MTRAEQLESCLEQIRSGMQDAARRSGRPLDHVKLVAVSKKKPAEDVKALFQLGQQIFGENRVQEGLQKIEAVGPGPTWHFIGRLQKNKAKYVVGRFPLLHGVNSLGLAAELQKRAAKFGTKQPVLLQVNLSNETTKAGFSEEQLLEQIEAIAELDRVRVQGLMTLPPPASEPEQARKWFIALRELRDRVAAAYGEALPELSMGMTQDYAVAIEEGATLIRVGRALFGERD